MQSDKQQNQKTKLQLVFAIAIFAILFIIFFIVGFLIINKNIFSDEKNSNQIDSQKANINQEEKIENPFIKNPLPPVDQKKLELEYKEKIKKIIDSYEESKIISSTEFWADFSNSILEKLFNMIVPAKQKEFHLELVRGFNIINQSANNETDSHKIGDGFEMVNNAIEKYLKEE